MLEWLLVPLSDSFGVLNVFRYITFRTIGAGLSSILLSFLLGPHLIRILSSKQIGQVIREEGPQQHLQKSGTPTMGGTLIVFAVVVSTLLWMNLANHFVWTAVLLTLAFGAIGFADDYLKVIRKDPGGLRGSIKFVLEFSFALIAVGYLYTMEALPTHLAVPFFKNVRPELGWLFIPFATLVVVGAANAVNLTDGLDGLATGPTIISAATFTLMTYVAGHVAIAGYLQIPYVVGAGEMAVFTGALFGAGIGFLWFNAYPAQVFMGDVGSLAIGCALGISSVVCKQELLLAIVGGIFVMETVSVIIQVGSFKLRGKRVFLMAPIHHHFELKGWKEPKIIVRFWILSLILAMMALATLKLR